MGSRIRERKKFQSFVYATLAVIPWLPNKWFSRRCCVVPVHSIKRFNHRTRQFVAVILIERASHIESIDQLLILLFFTRKRRPTLYNLLSIQHWIVINIHVNITGLCLSVDGKYYDNFRLSASGSFLGNASDDNKKITILDLYEITHHSIGGWWPEEKKKKRLLFWIFDYDLSPIQFFAFLRFQVQSNFKRITRIYPIQCLCNWVHRRRFIRWFSGRLN